MTAVATTLARKRRLSDRLGNLLLWGLAGAAAGSAVAVLVAVAWKIVDESRLSFDEFGFGFVTSRVWDPVKNEFGALDLIYGTALTSGFALLIAGPFAIAIALFLTELAPKGFREVVGTLVEMLAAIPSVILGLWGILVLGPLVANDIGPFLHRWLGWTHLFSGSPGSSGYLVAILVLTIMVVPIVASVTRELFLSVPMDVKEGALALGMTRWEMIRAVVLPHAGPGIAAALMLGLGRAIGEAIAVTQVIGGTLGIHVSLFETGDTLASRIAAQYQGASTNLQVSSIVYLAAILLVFSLVANVVARLIVARLATERVGAD